MPANVSLRGRDEKQRHRRFVAFVALHPIMEPMHSDSRFSYRCMGCGRCCANQNIQVNPFEIAMLAQNRGLSTTELIASAIEANAPILRTNEDGFCVFFEAGTGCTVHPARPLACRLYP